MSAKINAILTKQGVSFGDHAQDVITAVEPRDGETVREFCDRVLTERTWKGERQPRGDYYVTLRLVEPEPEPSDLGLPTEARPF